MLWGAHTWRCPPPLPPAAPRLPDRLPDRRAMPPDFSRESVPSRLPPRLPDRLPSLEAVRPGGDSGLLPGR